MLSGIGDTRRERIIDDWRKEPFADFADLATRVDSLREPQAFLVERVLTELHEVEEARFCSMCGAEFCSMRIDQDARDADGEMDSIDDETDLDTSPAADVNLPPTGNHDMSRVPEIPELASLSHDHDFGEENLADD